jgi:hypothetical protein
VLTLPNGRLDADPIGRVGRVKRADLDEALRYALDIRY